MNHMGRRELLQWAAAGVLTRATPVRASIVSGRSIRLGFDNFSIRALGWKAAELLEYAHSLGLDALLFSDLDVYESYDAAYLKDLRARAEELGVIIQAGTGSICPSSNTFSDRFGTAEEHLSLTIRIARDLGSTVARCYLGNNRDRQGPGGIQEHIRTTVQVLKSVKGFALDSGVKIAVENHAGDMQARELVQLIEMAGPEFVGATLDSGNATWSLEDPLTNLEILGPFALSTGIRDSMIWEVPDGAVVQWTAMGDGLIEWETYFDLYQKVCPSIPVQLEVISGFPRHIPYLQTDFWGAYPDVKASDFSRFIRLARRGRSIPPREFPEGEGRRKAEQQYQKEQLEKSIRYCRKTLGLGTTPVSGP